MVKKRSKVTILEAVDNLSSMAELEQEEVSSEISPTSSSWLDPRDTKKTFQNVKETFGAVHDYLEHVYKDEQAQLKEKGTQKGLAAIMQLADEAASKIDSCFKQSLKDNNLEEFADLKKFYKEKISSKIKASIAAEEVWQEEWGAGVQDVLDVARVGLKDLETVKRDREYELFYIKREDGRPFFNKNLVRHIKLVQDFDELVIDLGEEDPLLKLPRLQEYDVHAAAKEMREMVSSQLKAFYRDALKFKEQELVMMTHTAVMALFLASNPHNLMAQATGKSAISYFADFQTCLRAVFDSSSYAELISHPPAPSDRLAFATLDLLQALSYAFYLRHPISDGIVNFLQKLARREGSQTLSIWNDILDKHEMIRDRLRNYPNGPLFKTLDVFHNRTEGFDPILQENYPSALFNLRIGDGVSLCQRLPCPTKQKVIDKAEITEEFLSYLRAMPSSETHLVINLQNRTSWEEFARCYALESLSSDAEFADKLCVVTLPKQTDFYLQNEPYKISDAKEFLLVLSSQIESLESSGFVFPIMMRSQLLDFCKKVIPLIHKNFFEKSKILSKKQRLDFIEILYHFLILKIVDIVKPNHLSLTCKDSIDTGAVSTAGLFAFAKLLSPDSIWNAEEQKQLMYMIFGPAMQIRQRAVDIQKLGREISALSSMHLELEERKQAILKEFMPLFSFNEISVYRAA